MLVNMEKCIGRVVLACVLVAFSVLPGELSAHPGNTDSSGCHTCRTNCPDWGLSYGEYHCHNAKSSYQPEVPIKSTYGSNGTGYTEYWPDYEYGSVIDTTPICPANSYYDSLTDSCSCNYGYVVKGDRCVSGNSYCWDAHGYNSSYSPLSKSCECDYGYGLGSDGQCKSRDSLCEDQFGYNSEYDILEGSCVCKSGYVVDSTGSGCESGNYYCHRNFGYNSSFDSFSESCECDYGYELRGGMCSRIEIERNVPYVFEEATVADYEEAPLTVGNVQAEQAEEFKIEGTFLEVLPEVVSGVTNVSAAMRECPSKTCEVVRYYAEGAAMDFVSKYHDEWYQVLSKDGESVSGWIHESVIDLNDQVVEIKKIEAAATVSPPASLEKDWFSGWGKWLIRFLIL